MKKVLQERLNNLDKRIDHIFNILSDIRKKINKQDKIIELILEELKKEVIEKDYIAYETDNLSWYPFQSSKIKKVIKTRLKLINKKYDKTKARTNSARRAKGKNKTK